MATCSGGRFSPGLRALPAVAWQRPPGRPVIAFAGDGAIQMNGTAELLTIKHYWQEWSDPRLIVVVLHHNDLNQVTCEMRAMGGAPKFVESQALPEVSYAAFAQSIGLDAVPPLPPHATFGQMKDAALSLIKGEESRLDVIAEGIKTNVQEFTPDRGDR